jgi:uncharacterized phage protein (TIGR01671 family)
MREIKFRAWDERNKIMHNDFQFIKSGNEGNDWIVFTSDKQKLTEELHPLNNPYFQQQLIIKQFTGLKDKNGKEIYEGDIVNAWLIYHGEPQEPSFKAKIIYNEYIAAWQISYLNINDIFVNDNIDLKYCLEVIGNICKNPELLNN